MSFANVRVEPFDMPVWVRGEEKAWITAPFPQPLAITALGNSGATPPEGIEAELVGFSTLDAFKAAPDSAVRGKIVFVDHAMPRTQDGSSYGAFGGPRSEGPTIASKKGALAIVIRSIGTDHHRNPHTGVMLFADGATPIPAGALSVPDAEQVQRILKRGQPVTHAAGCSPRETSEPASRAMSSPKYPGAIPRRRRSWSAATSTAGISAPARSTTPRASPSQPRPPNASWTPGARFERSGLSGSGRRKSACSAGSTIRRSTARSRITRSLESDFGADRIWKVDSKLGKDREAEAKALQAALAPLGIVPGSLDEADGSDIGPLIADGLPGVGLSQDGTHYFDLHHTPDDTLDKVDPETLRQNVAAWTAMLAVLSGGIEPEPKRAKRR